jgi:molecular chaperone GrpE
MSKKTKKSESVKEDTLNQNENRHSEEVNGFSKSGNSDGHAQTAFDDPAAGDDAADEMSDMEDPRDELITRLNAELEARNDQLLRKAAEFENMRRRVQNERIKLFEDARIDALQQFLPVNDDLQRTIQVLKEAGMDEKYLKGVELVAGKMENVLQHYGVEQIDDVLVPFDVNLHDALMRQKADDPGIGSGMVLQVLENGYKIGERVIRHAKVIVSE